ncbi:hypothetical protein C6376_41420 [Streptomyces sp. P3]|nr:hypothetical protein C6376_41420 [Streptomyces sp. P3]
MRVVEELLEVAADLAGVELGQEDVQLVDRVVHRPVSEVGEPAVQLVEPWGGDRAPTMVTSRSTCVDALLARPVVLGSRALAIATPLLNGPITSPARLSDQVLEVVVQEPHRDRCLTGGGRHLLELLLIRGLRLNGLLGGGARGAHRLLVGVLGFGPPR